MRHRSETADQQFTPGGSGQDQVAVGYLDTGRAEAQDETRAEDIKLTREHHDRTMEFHVAVGHHELAGDSQPTQEMDRIAGGSLRQPCRRADLQQAARIDEGVAADDGAGADVHFAAVTEVQIPGQGQGLQFRLDLTAVHLHVTNQERRCQGYLAGDKCDSEIGPEQVRDDQWDLRRTPEKVDSAIAEKAVDSRPDQQIAADAEDSAEVECSTIDRRDGLDRQDAVGADVEHTAEITGQRQTMQFEGVIDDRSGNTGAEHYGVGVVRYTGGVPVGRVRPVTVAYAVCPMPRQRSGCDLDLRWSRGCSAVEVGDGDADRVDAVGAEKVRCEHDVVFLVDCHRLDQAVAPVDDGRVGVLRAEIAELGVEFARRAAQVQLEEQCRAFRDHIAGTRLRDDNSRVMVLHDDRRRGSAGLAADICHRQ